MESRLHKIIILGLLFVYQVLWSQEQKDFTYYNQLTYDHYLKKEWDQLIVVGKEALNNNFDFYYLRARLGIACYEKETFTAAIQHFEKALKYNSSEPVMLEYLYNSYIYASRYQDAVRLFQKNKQILGNIVMDYRPRLFDGMALEVGFKWSDHDTVFGTEAGNIQYGQVSFYNNIAGRIYLNQYAGVLRHTFIDNDYQGNNYNRYRYHVNQFDYYANAEIILGKGWLINPSVHFIGVDAITTKYSDLYYGIGLNKRLGRISMGFQYSSADINNVRIKQYVPKILYYPLGNNKLYLSSTSIFCSGDLDHTVIVGSFGIRVSTSTWLEGFYAYGRSQYISFLEGAIIYNNPDYLLSRAGGSLIQYLNPKTSLNFHYIVENKEQFISGDPYVHHVFVLSLHFKY